MLEEENTFEAETLDEAVEVTEDIEAVDTTTYPEEEVINGDFGWETNDISDSWNLDSESLDIDSFDFWWVSDSINWDFMSAMQMSTSDIVTSCIIFVWTIICRWRMFEKAGLPGWGAIIPFYDIYLRFKMAWRSWRWVLSLLFPPLFLIMTIVSYFDISKRFGHSGWFGLGLLFLNPIFIGILAFDKSVYAPKHSA